MAQNQHADEQVRAAAPPDVIVARKDGPGTRIVTVTADNAWQLRVDCRALLHERRASHARKERARKRVVAYAAQLRRAAVVDPDRRNIPKEWHQEFKLFYRSRRVPKPGAKRKPPAPPPHAPRRPLARCLCVCVCRFAGGV